MSFETNLTPVVGTDPTLFVIATPVAGTDPNGFIATTPVAGNNPTGLPVATGVGSALVAIKGMKGNFVVHPSYKSVFLLMTMFCFFFSHTYNTFG
jgi:hypothetical protein